VKGYPDDDIRRAMLTFWCAVLFALAVAGLSCFALTYPLLPKR
jgi:hypothetical protein